MLKHSVHITPEIVKVDNKTLEHKEKASALLTESYRIYVGDYPKFFKMDTLSKLGFVASELLLQTENSGRFEPREDIAVLLFNKNASLQADTNYQATIQDAEQFFPSPAAFVYTLPNIVTGEIAIRNKYFGETSFIVLEDFDPKTMARQILNAFQDSMTRSILSGWLDCTDENHFDARIFLLEKGHCGSIEDLEKEISTI